jgi:hypothetical protein
MFSAQTKTAACKGCLTPTVQRTYSALSFSSSVSIGDASPERIIVISGGAQSSGTTWSATLNGESPDIIYNGGATNNTFFAIWRVPTGTTASLSISPGGSNPFFVYAIYGFDSYKVVEFNNFYGFDSTNWSFTASPIPANTVLFGMWASNEDSSGSKTGYDFGAANKVAFAGNEVDGGGTYEVITVADPAKSISCVNAGRRRSFGYLALTCANAAI